MLLRCGQKEKIGEQARVLVDPVKRSDCRKLKNEMAGVKMKGLRVVHVGVQPPLCIVFEVEAQFDAKQVEQDVAVLQEYLTDALPPECQEELQVSALIVEQARTGAWFRHASDLWTSGPFHQHFWNPQPHLLG